MSQKPLNIGIIGAGRIAQTVHIPAFAHIKKAEIAAIADIDEYRVRWVADRHNIPEIFTDYRDLLKSDHIQAVDVCAPTFLHHQIVLDALSAGKHVFCEKPMAVNLEHCQDMVDAAKANQRILMIGMNQRFRADVQILKSCLDAHEFGHVFYAKAGWLLGHNRWGRNLILPRTAESHSGALFDLGQQLLDLMLWLMNFPEIDSISGSLYNMDEAYSESDFAALFIRTKTNSTLILEVSWSLTSDTDFTYLSINGTDGLAALNPLRSHREMILLKNKDGSLVDITPTQHKRKDVYKQSYVMELSHFVDCVLVNRRPVSAGDEVIASMAILKPIYQNAKKG